MSFENEQAIENLREAGLVPQPPQPVQLARTNDYDEIDRLVVGPPPAVKFAEIGHVVTGKIASVFARQATDFDTKEPRFWDDGSPIMEPVIVLDTDADGPQTLYCGSAGLREALRTACRDAGSGLRPDGYLAVRYESDGEPFRKGAHPPKVYKAAYDPPGRKRVSTSPPETVPVPRNDPPF
jgi:hypothetical protein